MTRLLFQVLRARLLQNPISEWDELFNRIAIFILECNGEQIRHWSSKFADLCHLFTDQLVSTPFTLTVTPYLSEWSIFIYCWVILQKMGWFENKPHLLI